MTRLTIWTNIRYPEPAMSLLRDGARDHELILSENPKSTPLDPGKPDAEFSRADIAFGQPDPDQVLVSPRLRWVHLDSAGYTRYDRDDLRASLQSRGGLLTNSSSVFNEPCAQHALAMMLAFARQIPQSVINQQTSRGWLYHEHRPSSFLLNGQTALIFGFGAIARRLIELLQPFRMNVVAVRRKSTGDEGVTVITDSQVEALLGDADHVINILPDNASTKQYFTATRLGRMKPSAYFYNLGRGTTVDQTALIAALSARRLAGAYLDVTDPEPLSPEHPLWRAPNCHITPHTAGGYDNEHVDLVRHFLGNLDRLTKNVTLVDRVIS